MKTSLTCSVCLQKQYLLLDFEVIFCKNLKGKLYCFPQGIFKWKENKDASTLCENFWDNEWQSSIWWNDLSDQNNEAFYWSMLYHLKLYMWYASDLSIAENYVLGAKKILSQLIDWR